MATVNSGNTLSLNNLAIPKTKLLIKNARSPASDRCQLPPNKSQKNPIIPAKELNNQIGTDATASKL